MCEVASSEFGQGLGCTISASEGVFASEYAGSASPKRSGFLSNFIRKSSSPQVNKKKSKSSFFGWKTSEQEEDERMSEFIEQLKLEGRSDEEIAMHLSYIHDVPPPPPPAPAPVSAPISPRRRNIISKLFQAIEDEFSLTEIDYSPEEYERQLMTATISSAPFYGAVPPGADLTYEDLASLEPVYVGAKSVNNLPSHKYDGTSLPGDQTNCTVCLCEFSKGEKLTSLPCVHFFHKECIDRWLMVGHTCPMCKTLVE